MADKFKVYAENANPVNLMTDDEFASDSQVDQGAKPREVIYSAKINTALRECSLAIKGLLNVLSTASQGEIGPNSTIAEVQNYLNAALGEKVNTLNAASATKLQTARKISLTGDATGEVNFDGTTDVTITADVASAASVDGITNNDSSDNANVNFNIGDKNFTKTVNNVAHATNADNATNAGNASTADKLNADAGDTNHPVYFVNGVPNTITGIDKSIKLVFTTDPGLQDNPTFNDIFYFNTMATDYAPIAQRAAKLTLKTTGIGGILTFADANIGSETSPVYFEGGIPKAISTIEYSLCQSEYANVSLSNLTRGVNDGKQITVEPLGEYSLKTGTYFVNKPGISGIIVYAGYDTSAAATAYFFGYSDSTSQTGTAIYHIDIVSNVCLIRS